MAKRVPLFATIDRIWDCIVKILKGVAPARFSIMMLLIVTIILLFVDQGQDLLRAITETKKRPYLQIFWFYTALLLWAFNSWYWARVILRFNFEKNCEKQRNTVAADEQFAITLRRETARILGILPFFVVVGAFYKTGAPLMQLLPFLFMTLLLALLFYRFVVVRKELLKRITKSSLLQKYGLNKLAVLQSDEKRFYYPKLCSIKELESPTWIMLFLLIFIDIMLLITFLISIEIPVLFGTTAILLFAAASWIAFGSLLVYFGSRYSFPVMTLLFLYAVFISVWNDNHKIRYLPKSLEEKEGLVSNFRQWIDKRVVRKKEQPLFIVAAEGGGIRAAYTTAYFLSQLQDKNSSFAQNLYAISGVSGGSLGAAFFTAMLREWYNQKSKGDFTKKLCKQDSLSNKSKQIFTTCAKELLSKDFLSPAAAYLLYPDLLQRFLPFPIEAFDRSLALEKSWELAWAKVFPSKNREQNALFSRGFLELWQKQNTIHQRLPNLFLNATWVERGKRVISSNIAIDPKIFSDSVDLLALLKHDLPLSTAVHNSARFTYVSPAGRVYLPNVDKTWGHIVDGGYFENSGASTANNILETITPLLTRREDVKPIVLVITNDPEIKFPCEKRAKGCKATGYLNELLSPIRALFATRGSRASYARKEIENTVVALGGLYLEVGLCPEESPLPLGWTLSDAAQQNMSRQLTRYITNTEKRLGSDFDPMNIYHLQVLQKELERGCIVRKKAIKGLKRHKNNLH